MRLLITILLIAAIVYTLRFFRKPIVKWLHRLKAKLQLVSLREAIHGADVDKKKTGRKNIVVYNQVKKEFESVQKATLKQIARAGKNKSNKAMTEGRIKMMKKKKRKMTIDRVKEIEGKSLYVTK